MAKLPQDAELLDLWFQTFCHNEDTANHEDCGSFWDALAAFWNERIFGRMFDKWNFHCFRPMMGVWLLGGFGIAHSLHKFHHNLDTPDLQPLCDASLRCAVSACCFLWEWVLNTRDKLQCSVHHEVPENGKSPAQHKDWHKCANLWWLRGHAYMERDISLIKQMKYPFAFCHRIAVCFSTSVWYYIC